MFSFVVTKLGFLKFIPLLPLFFDSLWKLWALIANPRLLDWIDEIESEVLGWEGADSSLHKYGGVQFNYCGKEIGHLHSNGLLDILVGRQLKGRLIKEERIRPHHVFPNSGWISFYIRTGDDKIYAGYLLKTAYKARYEEANKISAHVWCTSLPDSVIRSS